MFRHRYAHAFTDNETWNAIAVAGGDLYEWSPASTYIQEPPFLAELTLTVSGVNDIVGARALAVLGDSVTTDHISPAGSIAKDSPAGKFLMEHGVAPRDFNSYGSRRGNDRVMVRGTFANIRIRNQLVPKIEGGWTRYLPTNEPMTIYDSAMQYREAGIPTIVLAGAEYGTGSSRDWAAKGAYMLGIRAVIAASFERIHRSNLVGMGVLPLEFPVGQTWQSLGLSGEETYEILGLDDKLAPRSQIGVRAVSADGKAKEFKATVRIDTPVEMDYYRNGGILQTVLRKLATG
jgi:aconitate hydratase